jgi:hypothetical protein
MMLVRAIRRMNTTSSAAMAARYNHFRSMGSEWGALLRCARGARRVARLVLHDRLDAARALDRRANEGDGRGGLRGRRVGRELARKRRLGGPVCDATTPVCCSTVRPSRSTIASAIRRPMKPIQPRCRAGVCMRSSRSGSITPTPPASQVRPADER